MPLEIDYLGEGRSDAAAARTLILAAGHVPGRSYLSPRQGTGKQSLDRRLNGMNRGAAFGRPVLVVRDLDSDAPCPGDLISRLLPERNQNMLLRIAVRELEAWLLADRLAYAQFCGLTPGRVPPAPETLGNPKQVILNLALGAPGSRLGRHVAAARARQLPDWQALGEWHAQFSEAAWQPLRAAAEGAAPSLSAAIRRLRSLETVV